MQTVCAPALSAAVNSTAVAGGRDVPEANQGAPPIKLSHPDVGTEEIEAVLEVLRGGRIALGPKLVEFERAVADYTGCLHGVAVNSGTSALHIIVRSLGIGDGDEVITTPFSFIASANCILFERARPRFVDIEQDTLNIDCSQIESAITPRTKAILAVDLFGCPAEWSQLRDLARSHRLALIEDSCEALGARYRLPDGTWARAGSLGDVGTFAFYPNKQITTGEGGIVVTDRDDIAALCRSLRNQGRDDGTDWMQPTHLGYSYRIAELNCALGLAQMRRIDEILAARKRVASWYEELLAEVAGVRAPYEPKGTETSWFVYVVRLTDSPSREHAHAIRDSLRAQGIACANYFYPIHLLPHYRDQFGFKEGDFPTTERVASQTLALPFYNQLRREDVERVVASLQTAIEAM
jgi:perosamine synthetase